MASLLEQQRAFAAAISAGSASMPCTGVRPQINLDIYRNNSDWQFRNALALSFPVVRRRVGDDYFHELSSRYRRLFPSRSGDLHWVGREFPGFLAEHLAGGEYAWLADLAELEWARELASVGKVRPAVGAAVLARFAPGDLETLAFTFQPTLRLGTSQFPVVSVWSANQRDNAPPVDQSAGAESYMVLSRDDHVEVARLDGTLHTYLTTLATGATLAEAVTSANLDEPGLLNALQFQFQQGLVCAVAPRDHSAKR